MCLRPKWIYKKGKYKKNNYRGIAGEQYEIGAYSKCGTCTQCINEKCNNWVVRNYYEQKQHQKICFITLTYEYNPIILVKKDLQDFFKRLRTRLDRTSGEKIRYFASGEYGALNHRPHYHVIIYGWNDAAPNYLTINKRKNICYQAQLIQECWGHGRTSYQEFNTHEIPYTTLYTTANDEFKKAYKLTMAKAKKIESLYKSAQIDEKRRKELTDNIISIYEEMREKKARYMLIKEYNTWSIGLGWQQFEQEYNKSNNYTWTEYIEDKEFATPSPWVKKLANQGDITAAEEMLKREEMIAQAATEDEERTKNTIRIMAQRKKEILEWKTQKTVVETL